MKTATKASAGLGTLVLVVAVVLLQLLMGGGVPGGLAGPAAPAPAPGDREVRRSPVKSSQPTAHQGDAAIDELFANGTSDVMVTIEGTVRRSLPDDNEGSRHQRFIVELGSGRTVLVAHNIDLAPRVPLRRGDRVTVRGEYEWTEQGGTMHWTHHDPQEWREGGWIEHEGRRYE